MVTPDETNPLKAFWNGIRERIVSIVIVAGLTTIIVALIIWDQTSLSDDYNVEISSNFFVTTVPTDTPVPAATPTPIPLKNGSVQVVAGPDNIFI